MNPPLLPKPTIGLRYSSSKLPPPILAVRYYLPVEISERGVPQGRYHYCSYVYPHDRISPVGYCADNCDGHTFEQEARDHYKQYLLDHFLHFDGKLESPGACAACHGITRHYAYLDFHFEWPIIPLCRHHMGRAGFQTVFALRDYHLLQISSPENEIVATIPEANGPVTFVIPRKLLGRSIS